MNYLEDLFSIKGKTALVTGGATGIGRMAATPMVNSGATVFIASRKGQDCVKTAEEINALNGPGKAIGFAADVSSEEGIENLVLDLQGKTDKLDILINNAGVTWGAPLDEFPYGAWGKVMDVNVAGLFALTQKLLPMLKSSATPEDPSRIINLGSVMGTAYIGDGAYSYAASKAAVHHLTKILANEMASEYITINAFAPGPFQSKMTAFATTTDEQVANVGKGVPLGRIGSPEDIAGATLYLCSKAGAYITGAILPLDGGIHTISRVGLFSN
jgi:NAD(P)-dependent dehydrogenase (short-subunit alcohol dehydrogenase family)